MTRERLLEDVRRYYEATLARHGATPRGVDWNSGESQTLRFQQLAKIIDGPSASVLDFGCGYGALCAYLRDAGHVGEYVGFDLSDEMLAAARTSSAICPRCRYTSDQEGLQPADYVVASGVFNVKLRTPDDEWNAYMRDTMRYMASLARRGLAFNALTKYSDPEFRRPDLYYADPLEFFDFCQRELSRHVALLHDYPLYEFTILVRRQGH